MIIYALKNKNVEIAIVRKAMATTRDTVMKDFFKVMKDLNIYNVKNHNKTESKYTFKNGSTVKFLGADDEQKLRGLSSTIVWANEANELWYDDFFQLNIRCTSKFIVDFNPSDADSWIYNLPQDNQVLIKTTYKDNPFLPTEQIKEIEDLIETDEALYTIYALGERATTRQCIYTQWNWITGERPERFVDYVIGVDFGYIHPTAVVKVYYTQDNEIYIEPVLYESGLTGLKTAERFKELGLDEIVDMMCDFARPEIMEELRTADFNVIKADKSVQPGIDCMRRFKVFANEKDEDLKKEYQNYMYKKIKGKITDEPIKLWDDYLDAARYACMQIKKHYINQIPMQSYN